MEGEVIPLLPISRTNVAKITGITFLWPDLRTIFVAEFLMFSSASRLFFGTFRAMFLRDPE